MDFFAYTKDFMINGQKEGIIPESAKASVPVLTKRGGRIYRATFFYDDFADASHTIQRPFAWMLAPADGGSDYAINWCSAVDFIPTELFPLDRRISARLTSGELSNKAIEGYYSEIEKLMSQIIGFAFETNLDSLQWEIIERYKDFFLLLSYQGLYPFYDAIAPDFFAWINLVLIAKSDRLILESDNQNNEIAELKALVTALDMRISEEGEKEKFFAQIHEELQNYKTDAFEKNALSMQRDIIMVVDHVTKNIESITTDSPTPAGYKKIAKMYADVEQDLVDILYRQNVDPYTVEGDEVDVNRQKVLATVNTNNAKLDKTIAKRLAKGWERDGKVIRHEYIEVYLRKDKTSKN